MLANVSGENIKFIKDPGEVFALRKYTVNHSLVLYKWFLPLALLLFLAEIFLRRVGIVKRPKTQEKTKPVQQPEEELPQDTTQMLLSGKRRRKK